MGGRGTMSQDAIRAFCVKHRIRKLTLFGSALREDFGPESDVDVLVEFEEGASPGLFRFAALEAELSELMGRRVDLNTPGMLGRYLGPALGEGAEVRYGA
jgi:uncharacterized protein